MQIEIDRENYHLPVTIKSDKARKWVNYGLMNLWGFNHYAAIKCFKAAIKEDQNCCFAYWATAYAHGPHYNQTLVSQRNL